MMEIISLMFIISKNKHIKIIFQHSMMLLTMNWLFSMGNLWMENTNLYMFTYQDKYCSMLILLTLWIGSIIMMISKNSKVIMIMMLMMMVSFALSSTSMIMFYVWFEMSLIPLFIMIFWWGKTKERSSASMYMLIYTMVGSLPLLMTIFTFYKIMYSIEWDYLIMFNMEIKSFIMYWNTIVAFLIKIPVFGFHIWLPKAHVEAPVYGSMILASIILKLGGMGLMRIMMTMMNSSMKFNSIIMSILMTGTFMISLLCLLQHDMKSIVAYSSIVHMGISTISMMTMFKWGYSGAMIMMIGHGLCSSCMFYLVNMIYMRSNTRVMYLNKGMMNIEPNLTFMWFIMCVGNLGAPISLNFISELMMTNSIISWSFMSVPFLILINIFSSIFSMQLFMFTAHGNISSKNIMSTKMLEYHVILLHLIPLNFISFNSWMWNINY